jgi:hypothetical protein
MPHVVKRSRRPSLEDRIRGILGSPALHVPVDRQFDESLVSRLADFIGDYLMAQDQAETEVIAAAFSETNTDIAELAHALLGEVLAERSM